MAQQPTTHRNIDGIRPRPPAAATPSQKATRSSRFTRPKWFLPALAGVVIAGTIASALIVHNHRVASTTGSNEYKVVVAEVSKHYLLPSDETPALATVTDKRKLTTPFFKKAQNGDKILIYQKNQLAVIYRPAIDRIVAVGPVSIDTPPTGNTQASGN